jgi:hypothetical protein
MRVVEEPVWVIYRIVDSNDGSKLSATPKNVWDLVVEHQKAKEKYELIAEGLTFKTAMQMIGLTNERKNEGTTNED